MHVSALAFTQILGWIFLSAGAQKLSRFTDAVTNIARSLSWLPNGLVRGMLALVCAIELTLGGALVAGLGGVWPLLVAAALLVAFAAFSALPKSSACECGGIISAIPVGRPHQLANVGFAAGSLWCATFASVDPWWSAMPLVGAMTVVTVLLLLLTATAAWALRAVREQRQLIDVQRGVR